MKKHLIVSALLLISALANAQTLSIIPKVGATFSTISREYDDDIKSKLGFTLGAALDYGISGKLSIQPELNFIQKGYLEESSSTWSGELDNFEQTPYTSNSTSKTKQTVNYLEIPVLLKVMLGNDTRFFFNAGPSIGIGLGGKRTSESNTTTVYYYSDGDETQAFPNKSKGSVKFGEAPDGYEGEDWYIDNRIDFGLQFGGGVFIADKIMIEVRYGLGLSNLYDTDNSYETKNRVLQFTVGIPLQPK